MLSLVSFAITKDMEASKDIVQDFFLYLWNRNKKIDFQHSFQAYSCKAVKNLSLKYVQKSNRAKFVQKDFVLPYYVESFFQDKYENNKTKKVLRLLEKLPEKRKAIFISHVINGLSYSEIADKQDISINTVKTQMKRVYAFIRGEMDKTTTLWILSSVFLS